VQPTSQNVGVDMPDVEAGRLSISAPLARALINKAVGDSVSVETPAGLRSFEIVDVKFR
jgi:transcription elongation factor GreA